MDKPTCGTCAFWEPNAWFVQRHGLENCKEGWCHGDLPKAELELVFPAMPSKEFCAHHHLMPAYIAWLGERPAHRSGDSHGMPAA